jgi:hypothetical protein
MLRSCSERLRSYTPQGGTKQSPGRPARQAVAVKAAPCVATCRVIGQESAEAIVGVGSHPKGAWVNGNEPGEEKSREDSSR